jgi:hypothetical protein
VLASIADATGLSDAVPAAGDDVPPEGRAARRPGAADAARTAATLTEACHGTSSSATPARSAALTVPARRSAARRGLLALRRVASSAGRSTSAGLAAWRRRARGSSRPRADTICTLARAWTVEESWTPAYLTALRDAYELMAAWGDELLRLRVGALLARFLVEAEQLDEAAEILLACEPALRSLNLAIPGNDLIAAGGRLSLALGQRTGR